MYCQETILDLHEDSSSYLILILRAWLHLWNELSARNGSPPGSVSGVEVITWAAALPASWTCVELWPSA